MKQYSIYDFDKYYKPQAKAFEGRTPPEVHLDSPAMEEWYAEQMYYCQNGRTVRYRGGELKLTGEHYFFLNFFPFSVPVLDKQSRPTGRFEQSYGFYSNVDDYIFKTMQEASQDGMNYGLFGGRGFGKSFISVSILSQMYTMFDDGFHGFHNFSRSNLCFCFFKDMI